MSVQIGNQTAWAATPIEPFDYALAQGFDAFEWFPDKKPGAGWDESDLDGSTRQRIREAARARGIRLSVHARWQANLLIPDSYPLVLKDLELAHDLGAVLLNVHLFHERGLTVFVKAIIPLIQRTAEVGSQLAIENTPHDAPEEFNELFARLRALAPLETAHVGMCLDVGHANLCSATRNDYLGFCDRLDPRVPIIHVHLHENWGDADTHLTLFTGPALRDDYGIRGLVARLQQRNFSGSVILEQWPHPPSLLNIARDRLRQLLNSTSGKPGRQPSSQPAAGESQGVPISPLQEQAPGSSASGRPAAGSPTAELAGEGPAFPGDTPGFITANPARGPKGSCNDLAAELVAGDQQCRSWREKLGFVGDLLLRDEPSISADQLIDIAIYLRFLGAGEITCSEDGRHFRPAHHARIASQIQERLARRTAPDTVFIVRKIYPWLPSTSADFQRPEPLTRIRDIAHRNDIEPELKREIKTALQNKLHRCAGPEDLVTSAAMLDRIAAPGAGYSPAFVEQFKIFHQELKEFFNARSLDERLAALAPVVDTQQAELIELFRGQKADSTLTGQLAALGSLTALRQGFLDAMDRKPLQKQEFLLADIALDDSAFVLLSQIINASQSAESQTAWESQTEALILALKNVALSGVDPGEANAAQAELGAWGQIAASADGDELLRVKATALRCRRLAEDFSARTVALFSGRAEKLGRSLGVAEHAIRVFCESEIRANTVFQIAKLATSLLRSVRQRLGSGGWDVLVCGRAVGRARTLDTLDQQEPGLSGPVVALLKAAAGDEEIPKSVVGIILTHELPHLSHLGVRARQAGVVFATCEEAMEFERLRQLEGQVIALQALPDTVTWESALQPAAKGARTALSARTVNEEHADKAVRAPFLNPSCQRPLPRIPAVRLLAESSWIPLEQAQAETGGGKAAGARRLDELSHRDGAGFSTPPSIVVPFGVMEAQLDAVPAAASEYRRLVERFDGVSAEKFAAATQQLRELVQRLEVPDAINLECARRFAQNPHLIVRSSANCEDLEELAGAGLYDSVMNVSAADVASAVRTVWSSLWTRRAALSRQQAGIAHNRTHMAVVIQEMVVADFSFILHTVNPINGRVHEVYAEIVVGLGNTLASAATRGSPYRIVCHKDSGAATMLAFANFSQASRPHPGGGLREETVDYSRVELSRNGTARQKLGQRLGAIGRFIEEALQRPQDIEGVVAGERIWLVQARPQPGLTPAAKV